MRVLMMMFACFAFGLSGCGDGLPKPVPVGGKVTFSKKPVEGALVTFLSKGGGRSASGRTDAEGNFKLTTINTDDGAPPGEYTITIAKQESKVAGGNSVDVASGEYGAAYGQMMEAAASGTMDKVMKNNLPEKYANAADSGLIRTVVKGEENNFAFDL